MKWDEWHEMDRTKWVERIITWTTWNEKTEWNEMNKMNEMSWNELKWMK